MTKTIVAEQSSIERRSQQKGNNQSIQSKPIYPAKVEIGVEINWHNRDKKVQINMEKNRTFQTDKNIGRATGCLLKEIAEEFRCTDVAVLKALKRLKYRIKNYPV